MSLASNIHELLLGGATNPYSYTINNSLRLRSSASAYLSRTPASASNRTTFTWSGWVKKAKIATNQYVFGAQVGGSGSYLFFTSSDALQFYDYAGAVYQIQLITTQVFRDPSAWYHIVLVSDTTQATAANRIRMYVNGTQITTFGTATYPSQNYANSSIDNNNIHYFGYTTSVLDGYLAEVNFIDGLALDPSYFGATNSTTGTWAPKAYSGSYGTNGFYLPFNNPTSTLLSTVSNVYAGFGGTATNAIASDGNYVISNTTTGATVNFVYYDFGSATQANRYTITNLYFTGGTSTFSVQGASDVGGPWTTLASLSVTGSAQNFSGTFNGNYRYYFLRPTAFGANGQCYVDQFIITQDSLGSDSSGNGNNWATNNISLTAGVTYDAMLDSPTPKSSTVGNYAVLNPLQTGSYVTGSNANLTITGNTATDSALSLSSIANLTSGKWYWEYTQGTVGSETCGAMLQAMNGISLLNGESTTLTYGIGVRANGNVYGASKTVANITSWTTGDVIGIAVDIDNGAIYWSKNGTWLNSGVPTSGASKTGAVGAWTPSSSVAVTPSFGAYNGGSISATFGQRPFSYTPPTGFKALQTYNLPTPAIKKGNQHFDTVLQTGNTTGRTVSGLQFQPDLVMVKNRAGSTNRRWGVIDSVRGVNKTLCTNLTDAEVTSQSDLLTSFNSDGFTIGADAALYGWNGYVESWAHFCWKGGGTAITNTNGSITSQVSVNPTAGFSVVTWTGDGSTSKTLGHGLGSLPVFVISKNRTQALGWDVASYYSGQGLNYAYHLFLNTSDALSGSAPYAFATQTSLSSATLNLYEHNLYNGNNYVAYCFVPIPGYSAFGSYTGNGSADGPFVYCGFRPRFVMIKISSASGGNWVIYDNKRGTYNLNGYKLGANLADEENNTSNLGDTSFGIDFLSNGFKIRLTGINHNNSGATYIYAAFAENPFQYALAR